MIITKLILTIIFPLVAIKSILSDENVTICNEDVYVWNGYGLGSAIMNISCENYTISVTIEECNIGQSSIVPNPEYLILKQGDQSVMSDDGRIFAHITKPKKIYFYSSSVILELKTPTTLNQICKVTFEKAGLEPTTLGPFTTESSLTLSPDVSKYSTVYISGKSIDDFDSNLIETLKEQIVEMSKNYTETEGFCLEDNEEITTDDMDIKVIEECSPEWPDYENCIKLVYAISITSKINESCTLWSGYQITQSHLDLMWTRLAEDFIKIDFVIYQQPYIDNTLTWLTICFILTTLLFTTGILIINIIWKRKQIRNIASLENEYLPEFVRKISNLSLTPPYFQSIPPMFDKTYRSSAPVQSEKEENENEGFQYSDEILS